MIGIIKSSEIKVIRDGDKDRIILSVEMTDDDDVRTVELFNQSGDDNRPAEGCRVLVINAASSYKIGVAVSDDLAPEVDPGEREIYSTDDPVSAKKARIKLDKDGNIIADAGGGAKIEMDNGGDLTLNEGTDNAVRYSKLEEAFNQLQDDFDDFVTNIYGLHNHPTAPVGPVSTPSITGVASTADITDAKVDDIKLP